MPLSIEVLTSSSAPAWSTALMPLKSPLPSPNVMVPKQNFETRSPVLPSVAYSTMPPLSQSLLPLLSSRGTVLTVDHTPQSRGAYADLRICTGNRTYPRYGALLCAAWPSTAQDAPQGRPP